jgi:hypothetical protein
MLICRHPNNKRNDFSVYPILASTVDGVLSGSVIPRSSAADNAARWEQANSEGNYPIRITIAEALVLFVDPLVARTKTIPPDAIPVVRWWQKHRQPGPLAFEDLVMPLLGKRELARISEYTPEKARESWRDFTEAEQEALQKHRKKFTEHFLSTEAFSRTWFWNEAELAEFGVTAESSACDFMEGLLKSENLVQRHIQMAAHTRLVYKLGGEYPDLADLWSTEIKIQTDLGRFPLSCQAGCLFSLTALNSSSSGTEPS